MAESLRNQAVWLQQDDLPELSAGEYYLHTLMGKEAWNGTEKIGRLVAVIDGTAQTLLVIRDGTRERLIPAVKTFIERVTDDAVFFHLPPGFLEIDAR